MVGAWAAEVMAAMVVKDLEEMAAACIHPSNHARDSAHGE